LIGWFMSIRSARRLRIGSTYVVERPGLPIVKKLASGKTRLNWDERTLLAQLIAFQEVRTPAARQRAVEMMRAWTERTLQTVREANPEQKTVGLGNKDGGLGMVTLEEIEASQIDLEKKASFNLLRLTMGLALKLYQYYRHFKFTVYYSKGKEQFLTIDTPVIRVFNSNRTLDTGDTKR